MTRDTKDVFSSLVSPNLKSVLLAHSDHRASTTTAPAITPTKPAPSQPVKPAPKIEPTPLPPPIIQPAPKVVPRPGRQPHRPIQPGVCPLR